MYARTLAASVIILLLGISAVRMMTDGFEVLTTEQARRRQIQYTQPMVPDTGFVAQDGTVFSLRDKLADGHRMLVIDFIYTNCPLICRALGGEFQRLQQVIEERGLQDRIHLLSLSFDPTRDTQAVLGQYAQHLHADPLVWSLATVQQERDLDSLLKFFRVTVIPDGVGGFQHNAALIWVSPAGKFYRITDYDSKDQFELLERLSQGATE